MFSFVVFNGVAPHANYDAKKLEMRLPHKLAIAADFLTGITALAMGIFSLTCPSFAISLSAAAGWALIGGGATYTVLMLMNALTIIKQTSSFSKKYLFGNP